MATKYSRQIKAMATNGTEQQTEEKFLQELLVFCFME
jgi:hypothetical protein